MYNNIYDIHNDNKSDDEYFQNIERGLIINGHKSNQKYVIINQLRSNSYSKTYSALKIDNTDIDDGSTPSTKTPNSKQQINLQGGDKFMIKFYPKYLINQFIIDKLNTKETSIAKYYDDLKKEFENKKNDTSIPKDKIQEIYDIEENDKGIYVVTEFCETPLIEYLEKLRYTVKTNRCSELKYLKIFIPILEIISESKIEVSFSGLLNTVDIYVNENASGLNSSFIKITHPFFNQLETVFKILDNEHYPNFYPPEVINQFKQEANGEILLASTDLSDALSLINHNFDMWALGYLLYEILFEVVPFRFNSLEKAKRAFKENKINYKLKKNKFSDFIMNIIENSMKFNSDDRLNIITIKIDGYKEALADEKSFEKKNLKFMMNPEKYKENEETSVYITNVSKKI